MKTIKVIFVLALLIAGTAVKAQDVKVDIEKSSIEWLGKKVNGQHNGTIGLKSGSFILKDNKISSGQFEVDMTSIACLDIGNKMMNKKLVGHLESDDFFGVESFPVAKFVVEKGTPFVDGKATITGDITIKGKTEMISFEVVQTENSYKAQLNLDRSKFDIRYGSKTFFSDIGDKAIDDIFILDISFVVE